MSAPPPGYNPDVSALSGGTDAPIMRVMGGGGLEDVSMLEGGETALIMKMEGGEVRFADKPEIREIEVLPEIEKEELRSRMKKIQQDALASTVDKRPEVITPENAREQGIKNSLAIKPFQVEVYKAAHLSPDDRTELDAFADSFKVTQKKDEYTALKANFKAKAEIKWRRLDLQQKEQAGNPEAHKLVEIIPATFETIIIIPPVKGDIKEFLHFLDYLYENELITNAEKLKPNTALIFLGPTFMGNQEIMFIFLRLFKQNPEAIFGFQEVGAEDPLNLLPSYILFPHETGSFPGLIFGSKLPEIKNAKAFMTSEDLLHQKKKAFAINAGPKEDGKFSKYLLITEGPIAIAKAVKIPKCNTLETVVTDEDIQSPLQISKEILIFRFGVKEENPLICGGLLPKDEGGFKSSEGSLEFAAAPLLEIYIDGVKRKFRIPSSDNKVFENWKVGIFSHEEVAFLNSLHLSPFVLGILFNNTESWKLQLANFLKNLVTSKCFDDTSILGKAECEDTRSFLNSVYNYFFIHSTLEQEKDKPFDLEFHRPSEQELNAIVWPEELLAIDANDFSKQQYGLIDSVVNNQSYIHDVIVIHKTTGARKFMRAHFNTKKTNEEAKVEGLDERQIIAEILDDIKEKYPQFIFIY